MNYYVYAHLDEMGAPVYVGIGQNMRAWYTSKTHRSAEHDVWMREQLPELKVQIIASRVTRDEAASLEKQLITKLKPKFNKAGVVPPTISPEGMAVIKKNVAKLNSTKVKCPDCEKEMHPGMFARWHKDGKCNGKRK